MVSPDEVAAYFESEGRLQTDTSFPNIYDGGHPRCSGVAMGIDRLIMVLAGAKSISDIMPFAKRAGV